MTIDHLREVAQVAIQHFQPGSSKNQAIVIGGSDSDSELYEDAVEEQATGPREMFVKWIANWLGCVHVLMEEGGVGSSGLHSSMADTLRELPILPLEDGSFIEAAKSGIFFPPDYRSKHPYSVTKPLAKEGDLPSIFHIIGIMRIFLFTSKHSFHIMNVLSTS